MYLQSSSEVRELCNRARRSGRIGLDVEFIRERTYFPRMALVQAVVDETAALIDPLATSDLSAIEEILSDSSVLKVLHAPTQDLEIFHLRTGVPPRNVFDTQIAAAMLGWGAQISYSSLVEKTLGVRLPRSEAYTDWLHRPLTAEQESYALNDVRYLLPIQERLAARLDELGRTAWGAEEFLRYEENDLYETDEATLYRRVRKWSSLRPSELTILQELAKWREEEARSVDRPRRWVISDEILIQISKRAPRSAHELKRIRGLHPALRERSGAGIVAAVDRGAGKEPGELSAEARGRRRTQEEEETVQFLNACLRAQSRRSHIDPSLVARVSELEELAASALAGDLDELRHPVLCGWRGELVGRHLLGFLRGEVSVQLDPEGGGAIFRPVEEIASRGEREE